MSVKITTSYFICKCKSLDSLQQCIQTGVWACQDRNNPPHPKDMLSRAHSQGPVILIYSVNNQRGWHGYAESHFDVPSPELCDSAQNASSLTMEISKGNCKQELTASIKNEQATNLLMDTSDNANTSDTTNTPDNANSANKWHMFRVSWQKHFLTYNKQECLHFERTTFLSLPDGWPINKARNWQQVDSIIGKTLCSLIDEHYQTLNLELQLKKETKLSSYEESFFKKEEAAIKMENAGWITAVQKVEKELGKVHLTCPFGSQRYNCSVADSDQDIFIVYQAKTTQVLSLDPPRQTIKNSEKLCVDYTVLEVQRYCELLLAGDQRCVETLFLNGSEATQVASPEWQELCNVRDRLLTKSCFEKYLKEAQGNNGLKQIEKWKSFNPDVEELPTKLNKLAYICLRLLQNAKEILKLRTLRVYRLENSLERKELLDVRLGKYTYSNLTMLFRRYLTEINEHRDSLITDSVGEAKELVEKWLITCRLRDLERHPYSPDVTVTTDCT